VRRNVRPEDVVGDGQSSEGDVVEVFALLWRDDEEVRATSTAVRITRTMVSHMSRLAVLSDALRASIVSVVKSVIATFSRRSSSI